MASAARLRAPSARIFAPMMEPPQIVCRDFVLMPGCIKAPLADARNPATNRDQEHTGILFVRFPMRPNEKGSTKTWRRKAARG